MLNLFELALKARLPFIGVRSDDPLNFKLVLQSIAKKKTIPLPTPAQSTVGDLFLYYLEDMKYVTTEVYRKLSDNGACCVVLNPEKRDTLVFDAGALPTPIALLEGYLQEFLSAEKISPVVQSLNGLSLKAAQEVVRLTMARSQSCTAQEIRVTRMMLGESTPGLEYLNTEYDYYVMPKSIADWIEVNDKYFLNPLTPQKLMPRGLLMVGDPGTGKSLSSLAIARHWSVPLFRMDVSTSMNRFLGESESRIAKNLHTIEQNAPCVWLLDEVEKLFVTNGEEGTVSRILSQLLWWLQYHKSKVITILTSNQIQSIPPELYRPGRIDRVIKIEKLTLSEAKSFAIGVFKSILKEPPSLKQQKILRDSIDEKSRNMPHAEVVELVSDMIKSRHWVAEIENLDKI